MNKGEQEAATMNVEQAAKVLGIGRQTAYELARQGKLPGALRLGHRIVVSRESIRLFLQGDSVSMTSKESPD